MREEREKYLKNQLESYSNRINIHGYYSNFENAQYYRMTDVGKF